MQKVTTAQLAAWLLRFPSDTLVEVGVQLESVGYESFGEVEFRSPNLHDKAYSNAGDGWEFTDFTTIELPEDSPYHNKTLLQLGAKW